MRRRRQSSRRRGVVSGRARCMRGSSSGMRRRDRCLHGRSRIMSICRCTLTGHHLVRLLSRARSRCMEMMCRVRSRCMQVMCLQYPTASPRIENISGRTQDASKLARRLHTHNPATPAPSKNSSAPSSRKLLREEPRPSQFLLPPLRNNRTGRIHPASGARDASTLRRLLPRLPLTSASHH